MKRASTRGDLHQTIRLRILNLNALTASSRDSAERLEQMLEYFPKASSRRTIKIQITARAIIIENRSGNVVELFHVMLVVRPVRMERPTHTGIVGYA